MDKQREDFEAWFKTTEWYTGDNCTPKYRTYRSMLQAWQQAQKVAVPNPTNEVICAIEREVENQLMASGIEADPFRLDGEKIFNAMIEAGEKK